MCFVKAKDLASYRDDGKETSLEGHHYWKPFSLTFPTASKEKAYRNLTHPSWHLQDFCGHCIGLLFTPLFLYATRKTVPRWYALLFFLFTFPLALAHVFAFIKHRQAFHRYRTKSIVFMRLFMVILSVGLSFFAPSPEPSVGHILVEMVIKSPTMTLLFTSLMHRIEFKKHVKIHGMAFVFVLMWIPPFCSRCSAESSIMNKFHQMGYYVDWMISFTFLNKEPDPMEYPCWMLSVLLASIFGFILPTLIIFLSEITSRAMFIRSKISYKFHFDLFNYTNDAMKVGILAGLCSIAGSWFLLQLITKAIN